MSAIKTKKVQVGDQATAAKNIVLSTDTGTGDLVFSKGNHDAAPVEIMRMRNSDGGMDLPFVPAGTGAVATDVQSKLRESVSVKDFGAVGDGIADDTVAIQAAINTGKRVLMQNGVYKTGPLTLLQGTEICGETKAGVTLKPVGAVDIFYWSYAVSGVLFGLKIHNFTVDLTGFTGPHFIYINGMQYGSIGDIKFKFGTAMPIRIEFSYFNIYENLHFYQTHQGIWLRGTSYSDGPNHNVIRNTNCETLTSWALRMDFCRGNQVEIFDAEYSNNNLASAIILDNCSYCHIEHFWYEALAATVASPAILIQGNTASTNKKNTVRWSPQIIHPSNAIQVISSLDCVLDDIRFVGGTVNVQDDGNVNLAILNPQSEGASIGLLSPGSASTKILTYDTVKVNNNAVFTLESVTDGYNAFTIKNAGTTKYQVVTKPGSGEVSINCLMGEVLRVQNTTGFLVPVAGALQFANTITAASAGVGCLFVDSTDGKLKYKDASSVVNLLY